MVKRLIIVLIFFAQLDTFGQVDSVWNLIVFKKGEQLEIKDNMAEFSTSGFYLYRNCFYDLRLKDETKHTLRLIDIKFDTLVFVGISPKLDTNLSTVSQDTMNLNYKSIDCFLLLKNSMGKSNKKIKCDDLNFLFYKTIDTNKLESKYAYVFSSRDQKNELIPRLNKQGVLYYFEFGGKLYYHSGVKVKQPKYSNEEKTEVLNAALIALDLIVNKRLNVTINRTSKTNKKKSE